MKQIAIIGAGMSGLALATFLKDKAAITLFDKSRGVSGRMSTRYADPYQYDHGAQFFTARTRVFQNFLEPYVASGFLSEWKPHLVILEKGKEPIRQEWSQPRYVPSPRMNAWCQKVAESHTIHLSTELSHLEEQGEQWSLHTVEGDSFGPFDWVICSAPAPQTQNILPEKFCHHEQLGKVQMTGCFTLMLGFKEPLPLRWDAAMIRDSLLAWLAENSQKPGRDTGYSLVLQTTNAWAEEHLEDNLDDIQAQMLQEFAQLTGVDVSDASQSSLHRWRYADTLISAGHPFLLDEQHHLAACGDWCLEGRIEAAFSSGYQLARALEQYVA